MEKSSFFNSVNHDRNYLVSDFANFFSSLVTSGVFPIPSTNLLALANSDMTVTISIGKGWINGYCYENDSILILPIVVADGVLNRIDRIVLRMDTVGRAITAVVKKGVFASSPVAPTLQRDADGYELGIADVYVAAGTTSISQANITDLRMNTSLCGWVNSLIQADTTAIFNQYQAWFTAQSATYNSQMIANEATFESDFSAWFATIQGQLDGDIAGNLTNAINALGGTGRTTETVKGNADAIAATNENLVITNQTIDSHKTDNVSSFALKEDKTNKGLANGYAGLGSDSKVPLAQLPSLSDGAWVKIAEQILTIPTALLDFGSIPTGYKMFKLIYSAKSVSTTNQDLILSLNSTNALKMGYSQLGVNSSNNTALFYNSLPSTTYADTIGSGEITIFNSIGTYGKTVSIVGIGNSNNTAVGFAGFAYYSIVSEINEISLQASSTTIAIGGRFTLWGCK